MKKYNTKLVLWFLGVGREQSQDKLYNELGWESLSDRRWYRRLCLFYKIINHHTSQYLHDHIPAPREVPYSLRSSKEFNSPATRTLRFSNSFPLLYIRMGDAW